MVLMVRVLADSIAVASANSGSTPFGSMNGAVAQRLVLAEA
jgi:hypothetical protein